MRDLGLNQTQLSVSLLARIDQLRMYASVHAAYRQLEDQRGQAGKASARAKPAGRKAAQGRVSDGFARLRKHPGWPLFERVSMTPEAKRTLSEWRRLGKP